MAIDFQSLSDPGKDGLRKFGISTGLMVAFLFGLAIPWIFGLNYARWPWVLCLVLVTMGLIVPTWLRPVYFGWMRFGLIMSRITTPIILGIVFFLVLFPMGLVAKMFRPDPMRRNIDNSSDTYRIKTEARPAKNLERPF